MDVLHWLGLMALGGLTCIVIPAFIAIASIIIAWLCSEDGAGLVAVLALIFGLCCLPVACHDLGEATWNTVTAK
jgi:multisubunit Na+/H+ antiporter MnhG subunit